MCFTVGGAAAGERQRARCREQFPFYGFKLGSVDTPERNGNLNAFQSGGLPGEAFQDELRSRWIICPSQHSREFQQGSALSAPRRSIIFLFFMWQTEYSPAQIMSLGRSL